MLSHNRPVFLELHSRHFILEYLPCDAFQITFIRGGLADAAMPSMDK